jgi:predicted ATP-grasp superfamily ATP-dependent carboligase
MPSETSPAVPAAAPERTLVVAGASVRGFAVSAARAGWHVFAADLFRDLDLVAAARTAVLVTGMEASATRNLVAACGSFPAAAWCYTGGLENHPDVIAAVSTDRRLFGSPPAAVRAVRDVDRLADAVRRIGLLFPETLHAAGDVPGDGSFLVKPAASAGGRGIRRWHGESDPAGTTQPRHWQRYIRGRSWAASYVLGHPAPRLLGVSRQFTGLRWCHAQPFAYCGSADMPLPRFGQDARQRLERLGRLLAEDFGLLGLVGVDLIVDQAGRTHVIEVNPRPTASMELHERALGESLAALHIAACDGATSPRASSPRVSTAWAKGVLFARSPVQVTPATVAAVIRCSTMWSDQDGWPAIADIPAAPQAIAAGRPLVTLFATGPTPAAAWRSLRRRAASVDALLTTSSVPGVQPASRRGTAAGASAPTL